MRAPHEVPAAHWCAAITAAYLLARLPALKAGGVLAAALSVVVASLLFLGLTARLSACFASKRALAATALAAALGAYAIRRHGGHDLVFDLALVTAAAAGGRLFVNEILEAWWIVPLGVTGAFADLVSVFMPGAPTHEMIETGSPVLEYLLLVWPRFTAEGHGFVGVSDYVIAAILYAHGLRFGFDPARSFRLLAGGLVACLLLAGLTGLGLPAIPFLFVAYVAGHAGPLMATFRGAGAAGSLPSKE